MNEKKGELMSGSNLDTLELKANLNPEQRAHLDVLKDKTRKILGGKTKQELAKLGDLATLKKYREILRQILQFLKTKEIVPDAEMRKQRQIKKIEYEIMDILEKHFIGFREKEKIKLLREQINRINKPDEDRYEEYDEDVDVLDYPKFTFQQIVEVIASAENLDPDDFYHVTSTLDKDRDAVTIWIGVAGKIDAEYCYWAAFQDIDGEGNFHINKDHDSPKIEKYNVRLENGDLISADETFANWSEQRKAWINELGEVIKV